MDTSPFLVLVVGSFDPNLLGGTPYLKAYTPEDFGLLEEFVTRFDVMAITPHVATETAHFIGKISKYGWPEVRIRFIEAIHRISEIAVGSRAAATRREFAWLDLADCTLLEAAGPHDVLLTSDAPLALQRQRLGLPVVNFNQLRDQAGIF